MKDKTQNWLETAEMDLEFAKSILKNNQRPFYAVHFCHQALEKIMKAVVQEVTDEDPKRTHNFKTLWEQGEIPLSEAYKNRLLDLMPHYLGARYPDDVRKLHTTYNLQYVRQVMNETEELFQWLRDYLMSKKQ